MSQTQDGSRDISHRIKATREKAGLTQADFAKRLEVALSTVQKWEQTRGVSIGAEHLAKICRTFQVDPGWLLLGSHAPGRSAWLEDEDVVDVPFMKIAKAADGTETLEVDTKAGVTFAISVRRARETTGIDPRHTFALLAPSMAYAPEILARDFLFFDKTQVQLHHGRIHLVKYAGHVMVRAIRVPHPGHLELVAINPLFGATRLDCAEAAKVESLGRLVVYHRITRP